MTKLVNLLKPGRIGKLKLDNRLIMASMGILGGEKEHYLTDEVIAFYVARAKGGAGLLITGAMSVNPQATITSSGLHAYDDKFVPRLRDLPRAVHAHGGTVVAQLQHQGPGRLTLPVGPSAVPVTIFGRLGPVPRVATREDIKGFIRDFAEAARRIKEAGFDGVELMGGSYSLISSFGSPFTNKRRDEYGGSPEKRARFACEIIEGVRQKVGPDFPLILLVAGRDFVGEEGLTIEEAALKAPLFVEAGADALRIRDGLSSAGHGGMGVPGFMIPAAAAVKKAVDVPVIIGSSIDLVLGEQTLAEGKADFIGLAKAFLADPDIPNKVREGRLDEVRPCLGQPCMECGLGRVPEHFAHCLVNAALGHEAELAYERAKSLKEVMVVGGGLAGMEAARVLAERGHQVSLYERSERLGGQWNVAVMEPGNEKLGALGNYLSSNIRRLGVRVVTGKEVTAALVKEIAPQVVVLATGSRSLVADIPGVKGKNVVLAWDAITGKARVGETVAIVGAGLTGIDTAVTLVAKGKQVSLVDRDEIGGRVLAGMGVIHLFGLKRSGVKLYPGSLVVEIKEDGVVVGREGKAESIGADTVVLAVGLEAENGLAAELKGVVPELYSVGDCVTPGKGLDAIHNAFRTARII
ncbi:MAG: FAD-dependent oxidoreductase [Chloroflexota bacterium]